MDIFGFPTGFSHDVKIYLPQVGVLGQGWQTWQKPRGVSMVYMVTVGGGGAGGGGMGGDTTAARGGGSGGACSGMARFMCPAMFLPDIMYVHVGAGGRGGGGSSGGSAGNPGASGINSYIAMHRPATPGVPTLPNIICYSNASAPGPGSGGSSAGGVAGGAVPSIALIQPTNIWGEWFATIGIVGAASSTGAGTGTVVTAWATLPMSPGSGAGGVVITTPVRQAGSGQTATAITGESSALYGTAGAEQLVKGGPSTGEVSAASGIIRITPFFNTGGGSGSSAASVFGGTGGAGGYGCGGGGGGACSGGGTGGNGGHGGPGIVIIISW